MAALTDAVVVIALDGAVNVAVVDNGEVDVILADNGEAAPGTMEEDGRRIKLPSVLPGSEGEPKSAKKTLATDSKDPTAHMDQLEHQTGNDRFRLPKLLVRYFFMFRYPLTIEEAVD
ncbi:hypothetical protein RvY_05387 [Ramazzottius varieornatus]|uniref:Uncharacterized protein n=1 Tax=Ramazzottius varieornatus TaxID=947166 RepID=A0A1D1V4N6_RAMVA|nr:hypothetical protein RvY_05387 [Ramazzottius varieornatus]